MATVGILGETWAARKGVGRRNWGEEVEIIPPPGASMRKAALRVDALNLAQ